jgi:type IV pilus assembly protein PilE
MITVAIIGILLAIGVPIYKDYLIRANRAAAKTVLLEVVSRQEQYAMTNRAFAADTAALGMTLPSEVSENYDVTIDNSLVWSSGSVTMSGFVATATPKAGSTQAADGTLSINQFGLKSPANKW